jgi:hypothetical protein
LVLIFLQSTILSTLCNYAYAKYVKSETMGGNVTVTVDIGTILLREHRAERQPDGSYELIGVDSSLLCDGTDHSHPTTNSYTLLPGLDVPKDPHVVITGKTDIPAHLYVEIVTDTIDNYDGKPIVSYTIASSWRASERPAQHGGIVYEYVGTGTSALALTAANLPEDPIYILANNKVRVSQHAKHADHTADGDTDVLQIYGYLIEATGD